MITVINKLLIFALMFAILIVSKEIFLFIMAFVKNQKFEISTKREILFGTSLSYILTIIFTGLF